MVVGFVFVFVFVFFCHDLASEPERIGSRVRIKYRVIPAGDDRSKRMNARVNIQGQNQSQSYKRPDK